MACLKNPPPTPVCATPPRSRPLPPLSSNEALALWTQASHLFHHLNWTSAALLIAQILRRTSTEIIPHISRAKLWANLGVVRFHLGDYSLALEAIEEALDEVSASMGLKTSALEDEDALDGVAMRNRLGRARSATTTLTDFTRAGAARIAPSKKNSPPVSELAGASETNVERDTRPPPHIGKAATVANSITTMGRFIRAGAVWSVTNSSAVDRAQISARRGTKTLTRERSIRAPQATTSEEPEVNSIEGAEATGSATTAEAGRAAKRKAWSHQASKQTRANEKHGVPPDALRPLAQPQEPLPFPPETPLLFFLAGLVAYHLPTTPHSPINYFRVAHAYFKRCLWALSLLSHTTTAPTTSSQSTTQHVADLVADNDEETYDYDFAGEYDAGEEIEDEQADGQASGFDFSPYGFAFVLSRRSVITNALTCDYEAECVEGRGTLVVGRCRGVDGLGAGVEGVWFEAPLG